MKYDPQIHRILGVGEKLDEHDFVTWGPRCSLPGHTEQVDGLIGVSVSQDDDFIAFRALPPEWGTVRRPCNLPGELTSDFIPQGDKERKEAPMFRGLLGYFPAALFAVAQHSYESDQKHNPGSTDGPTWARDKSADHADCMVRHLIDAGKPGTPERKYHLKALAWRALALLQEECEREGSAAGISSRGGAS